MPLRLAVQEASSTQPPMPSINLFDLGGDGREVSDMGAKGEKTSIRVIVMKSLARPFAAVMRAGISANANVDSRFRSPERFHNPFIHMLGIVSDGPAYAAANFA